jgi:hypothetical protein
MIRLTLFVVMACSVVLGQTPVDAPLGVARRFLPPNSELAQLYTFDYGTGHVAREWPAVLTGHVVAADASDIVFAYYSPRVSTVEKTLFISLLHKTAADYQKVYELSFRSQVLLTPEAMKLIQLPNTRTDALAVVAGMGALMGGHLDVFVWRDPRGWRNLFPPNDGMHYFYFFPSKSGLDIALSWAKDRGADGRPARVPPPSWYRWDGQRFVKIAPPG